MFKKMTILGTLAIGFFIFISCLSHGNEKPASKPKLSVQQNLPSLLSSRQLNLLNKVSKITLFDMVDSEYEGEKSSKMNKVLSNQEKEHLLSALTQASKDTMSTVNNSLSDAYQLVLETEEDFFTLAVDANFKQVKIGDVRRGVNIYVANDDFFNSLKTIVANE